MTHLRQAMLEELHRRNYAASTITYYIQHVEQFTRFFKRSPDRLTPTHSYDLEKRAALDFWGKRLEAIVANKRPAAKLLRFSAAS